MLEGKRVDEERVRGLGKSTWNEGSGKGGRKNQRKEHRKERGRGRGRGQHYLPP